MRSTHAGIDRSQSRGRELKLYTSDNQVDKKVRVVGVVRRGKTTRFVPFFIYFIITVLYFCYWLAEKKNAGPACDNWTSPYLICGQQKQFGLVWTELHMNFGPPDDDASRMPSIHETDMVLIYPSISQGDGELDLHEAETGLREIILRRVSSKADGEEDGAG